jgi:hypothetical protein
MPPSERKEPGVQAVVPDLRSQLSEEKDEAYASENHQQNRTAGVQTRNDTPGQPADQANSGNRCNRVPTKALNLPEPNCAFEHVKRCPGGSLARAHDVLPVHSIGTKALPAERGPG